MVLVLENEVLEVVLQRQVLRRFAGAAGGGQGMQFVDEVVQQVVQLDIDAQQVERDARALAEDHRPLDGVLQLAHVARPVVVADRLERLGGELQRLAAHARTLAGQEHPGDLQHVVLALAQRRQAQRDDVQAVVEVLAELAVLGQVLQVAVGRGDQAHVDLLRLHRADPADLAFLEDAQQARLGLQRQLADLVEEQGAAVGGLDQAGPSGGGAGEGALLVAEQLRLDQGFRDRRAVHRDQRRLGALRQVVQGARHQLLAGAGLALDQYGGIGRRDLADLAVEVLHGRTVADDANLATRVGRRLAALGRRTGARRLGAAGLLTLAQDACHGLEHLVVVEGLGDVVDRAELHRVDRRAQAGVAGHDQHRRAAGQADQLGTRGAGQAQVAEHQVEAGDAVAFLGLLHRTGFADLVLVALEQAAQCGADDGFVFDDKNMWHVCSALAACSEAAGNCLRRSLRTASRGRLAGAAG
ncbi:hypothetical protein D3C85_901260 [compost metagenome]